MTENLWAAVAFSVGAVASAATGAWIWRLADRLDRGDPTAAKHVKLDYRDLDGPEARSMTRGFRFAAGFIGFGAVVCLALAAWVVLGESSR